MEREIITKNLGQNIRRYRTKKQISQENLALSAGLHPAYLGRLERGEKCPTIDTLFKISEALEISVTDLLIFEETRKSSIVFDTQLLNSLSKLSPDKLSQLIGIIESMIDLISDK